MQPKKHQFHYRYFMWWFDLDELETLAKNHWPFSLNGFNLFSFHHKDHYQPVDGSKENCKQTILSFAKNNGFSEEIDQVMLLTNARVLGYIFNPVSFYFLMQKGKPQACVVQVGNTFGEMKLFWLPPNENGEFDSTQTKFFYVSPFTNLDDDFHFRIGFPDNKLKIHIDTHRNGERYFLSTLSGTERKLTTANVLLNFFKFPLVTVKVITAIHWQAMVLWFKKIPYQRKADNPELQKDVLREFK